MIERTLDIGWRLLSMLPKEELTRVSLEEIKQYYEEGHGRRLTFRPPAAT